MSSVWWRVSAGAGGTHATQRMRALHTPLHDVTCGFGDRVSTHTWPT